MPGRAVGEQVGALQGRVGDAEVGRGGRVVGAQLELGLQLGGDVGAAHRGDPADLAGVGDRHDPRDDRHVDADLAGALDELVVAAVVEEQLRDQEAPRRRRPSPSCSAGRTRRRWRGCGPRGSTRRRSRSRSRRGSARPARASSCRPPSVAVHSLWPCGGSPRSASTFSTPRSRIRSSVVAQLLDRRADAGEVRHRLEPEVALHVRDDVDRLDLLGRRAAGAVGDRDEGRVERARAPTAPPRGCASPASVLGGKNSKEKDGPVPAAIRSSIRMERQSVAQRSGSPSRRSTAPVRLEMRQEAQRAWSAASPPPRGRSASP